MARGRRLRGGLGDFKLLLLACIAGVIVVLLLVVVPVGSGPVADPRGADTHPSPSGGAFRLAGQV